MTTSVCCLQTFNFFTLTFPVMCLAIGIGQGHMQKKVKHQVMTGNTVVALWVGCANILKLASYI